MNINKDTKIRIRVPKSLYESIQQEIKKDQGKGVAMENEEPIDEDMFGGIVQQIIDLITTIDPSTIGYFAGVTSIVALGKKIADLLNDRKASGKSNPNADRIGRANEANKKSHGDEEVVREFSMEQLSEAVKKAKAKKAAAAKKVKEAAKKEKEDAKKK